MGNVANLRTLVMMQLRDRLDLSFLRSKRRLLFRIAAEVGQIVLAGGGFFALFYIVSKLMLFSASGYIPPSLITAMLTLILALSTASCTAGLTESLFRSADNRVLLTFPVQPSLVFLSKCVLYLVFELKRNATFLLPMYVAYGIVYHAVWYYYPWLLLCWIVVSMLPVALGAVLSMPTLFVADFVKRFKWLQALLFVGATALLGWGLIRVIRLIPENIDLAGNWRSIFASVQTAMDAFARYMKPINYINLMIMGGSTVSYRLFSVNTLYGALYALGTIAVCFALAYFAARPLFFKMASKQFEYEKTVVPPRKNKVRDKRISPFVYELKRSLRSGKFVLRQAVSLLSLPIAVFLLNKTYAAMNTRLTGQYMTIAFSLLICLLIVTSDNVCYASVYSADGSARPLAKTQPVAPQLSLFARLVPRAVVIAVSAIAAVCFWQSVTGRTDDDVFKGLSSLDSAMLAFIIMFVGWAHLLWSAELDVMKPQHEQYATLGASVDNPNERTATVIAFLISAIFAFCLYFIMREGQTKAIVKLLLAALAFLAARTYLFFTRIRLYYAEK